jgi:hypothetical protein
MTRLFGKKSVFYFLKRNDHEKRNKPKVRRV